MTAWSMATNWNNTYFILFFSGTPDDY
jgi:hypothetical protein